MPTVKIHNDLGTFELNNTFKTKEEYNSYIQNTLNKVHTMACLQVELKAGGSLILQEEVIRNSIWYFPPFET